MEKLDKLYVVKANDNMIYYYAQRPDVKFNEETNEFDIIPQNNVDPIAAHEDIDSESGLQPCKVYELTSDGLDAETSTAKVKPAPIVKEPKNSYDKKQCVYGENSTMSCALCSATCEERYKDFLECGISMMFI